MKPFLTYQQQIDKLITDKHLVIDDRLYAENKLKEIGYFSLIGGYKKPFRNPMTRVYENNTTFLLPRIKSRVSCNFFHIDERELNQYLKVLVLYRNVCAHNERLFSHTVYSEIPDTTLHRKLSIPKIGNQYIMGKKDLFSVVIAFRYFLSNQDFLLFKKDLINLIERYLKSSQRITNEQLLNMMGFPTNWKNITRYKL